MFNICLNAFPSPVYTNLNTNEVQQPPPSPPTYPCTKWHLWFPYNYAPIWWWLTTNCVCLFLCVCVCVFVYVWMSDWVREWVSEKTTLRLLFKIVMTISAELNHGCSLAWIRCYTDGMPGSDFTFPRGVSSQMCKSTKPLKYVAVVALNLTASSDNHENSKHFDVCSMHCVSIVAGCADSLWAFRKCLWRRSLIWNQPLVT